MDEDGRGWVEEGWLKMVDMGGWRWRTCMDGRRMDGDSGDGWRWWTWMDGDGHGWMRKGG